MDKIYDIIIIGGGASGLFAAALLSETGYSVALCEASSRVGKKLLMTGNGRCNLMNAHVSADNYNNHFAAKALDVYDSRKLEEIFYNQFQLPLKQEESRFYPFSDCASTVLNAIRIKLNNVDVFEECLVTDVIGDKRGYCVIGSGISLYSENVCLASGSMATIGRNSHSLFGRFGHRVTPLRPALLPLSTADKEISTMQGHRRAVDVSLIYNGKQVVQKSGEVLFKQLAISGIVSYELSAVMARNNMDKAQISIDFFPQLTLAQVTNLLLDIPMEMIFHKDIAQSIIRMAQAKHGVVIGGVGIASDEKNNSGSVRADAAHLAYTAKHYLVNVTANQDSKAAQVTNGGLDTLQFSATTMQSKLSSGLFAIGEALDIDGDCGGYNLMWAWASAAMLAENFKHGVRYN